MNITAEDMQVIALLYRNKAEIVLFLAHFGLFKLVGKCYYFPMESYFPIEK